MVREKDVNYDRIQTIEQVFRFFEVGKERAEIAEKELEKWKDK